MRERFDRGDEADRLRKDDELLDAVRQRDARRDAREGLVHAVGDEDVCDVRVRGVDA